MFVGCKNAPFVPFEPGDHESPPIYASTEDASTVTLSRSEGSVSMDVEMHPEYNEWAQHDRAATHQRQHCQPER